MFYEIFRYLEENVPEDLLPREFHRTKAFESDLNFYLGENWKRDYEIRNSVKMYLKHLYDIKNRSPILLLAYVYHLYMGLLQGENHSENAGFITIHYTESFSLLSLLSRILIFVND